MQIDKEYFTNLKDKFFSFLLQYYNWSTLKAIQNNKIVKSTYIWLFIVPLLAKILSKIDANLYLDIAGKVYEIDLVLPFSWKLFFLSALCFVAGNILFVAFCPKLIKDYNHLGEFLATGKTEGNLFYYMDEELKRKQHNHNENLVKHIKMKREYRIEGPEMDVRLLREDAASQMFWMTYEYYLKKNNLAKVLAGTFYLTGFFFFSIVLVTNSYWVFEQFNK